MLTKINWTPNHTDLRKFGLAILIGFGLIGGFLFWKGYSDGAKWVWIISAAIGVLAIAVPPLSKPFYLIWMSIAMVMGTIISFIIVALIYYFIITPVGLFMKLIGRDALRMNKGSFSRGTYWDKHPDISQKEYYKRLF